MVREGLQVLVNGQPDMEVVGEADNGLAAISLSQQLAPDVVVMDISMPELNGLKATEKVKELCPNVSVLALTRHTDDGYLQQLLEVGASGYVLKQSASETLVQAIRTVASGGSYIDPAITGQIVASVVGHRTAKGSFARRHLSPREKEVLRLVAWGYLNKEIAERLHISVKTAETHKANAMDKMEMKSRIDIVRYALRQGWLQDN